MTTIDARTRHVGDAVTLGSEWLHNELPGVLSTTGALGARGVEVLGLSTLGFDLDGLTAHLAVGDGRLVLREGSADEGPIAALYASAFSDLVQ